MYYADGSQTKTLVSWKVAAGSKQKGKCKLLIDPLDNNPNSTDTNIVSPQGYNPVAYGRVGWSGSAHSLPFRLSCRRILALFQMIIYPPPSNNTLLPLAALLPAELPRDLPFTLFLLFGAPPFLPSIYPFSPFCASPHSLVAPMIPPFVPVLQNDLELR